ncbi:hypothetical protein THAOC_20752, partial [Thalassiosira oceanica]
RRLPSPPLPALREQPQPPVPESGPGGGPVEEADGGRLADDRDQRDDHDGRDPPGGRPGPPGGRRRGRGRRRRRHGLDARLPRHEGHLGEPPPRPPSPVPPGIGRVDCLRALRDRAAAAGERPAPGGARGRVAARGSVGGAGREQAQRQARRRRADPGRQVRRGEQGDQVDPRGDARRGREEEGEGRAGGGTGGRGEEGGDRRRAAYGCGGPLVGPVAASHLLINGVDFDDSSITTGGGGTLCNPAQPPGGEDDPGILGRIAHTARDAVGRAREGGYTVDACRTRPLDCLSAFATRRNGGGPGRRREGSPPDAVVGQGGEVDRVDDERVDRPAEPRRGGRAARGPRRTPGDSDGRHCHPRRAAADIMRGGRGDKGEYMACDTTGLRAFIHQRGRSTYIIK